MLLRDCTTLQYKVNSPRPMNILCFSDIEALVVDFLLDVRQARGAV
jgi:hypothetical protein